MASIFSATTQPLAATRPISSSSIATPSVSNSLATNFLRASLAKKKATNLKTCLKVRATATISTPPTTEEIKEYALPSWAAFEFGKAPVYWKTTNGLPPMAGEDLRIFYNPAANNIAPNENFGIGFNGGFNQPIMCGGEPRAMLKKSRGSADPPIYSIHLCIPKHALNLIFSFTNGTDWDGPYRLQFQVPKGWRNKPVEFFNEGLAEELSQEGACERAIFPDTEIVVTSCAMVGNLTLEGGDRCDLNLVSGCTDPDSPAYDPLANVDDGSCPPFTSDSEE